MPKLVSIGVSLIDEIRCAILLAEIAPASIKAACAR